MNLRAYTFKLSRQVARKEITPDEAMQRLNDCKDAMLDQEEDKREERLMSDE